MSLANASSETVMNALWDFSNLGRQLPYWISSFVGPTRTTGTTRTTEIETPLPVQDDTKSFIPEKLIVALGDDVETYSEYVKYMSQEKGEAAYSYLNDCGIGDVAESYLNALHVDTEDPYRRIYKLCFMAQIGGYYANLLAHSSSDPKFHYKGPRSTPKSSYVRAHNLSVELLGLINEEGVTITHTDNTRALRILLHQVIEETQLMQFDESKLSDLPNGRPIKAIGVKLPRRTYDQENDSLMFRDFIKSVIEYTCLLPPKEHELCVKDIFSKLFPDRDSRVVDKEFQTLYALNKYEPKAKFGVPALTGIHDDS